jgi:hypothetical protein
MDRADVEFIEKLSRSLESEMHQGFAVLEGEMRKEFAAVNSRLTRMNDRMDRVGGLVNGGARAIAKLAEWSERTDITTADLLHRATDIDQRRRKLEQKKD